MKALILALLFAVCAGMAAASDEEPADQFVPPLVFDSGPAWSFSTGYATGWVVDGVGVEGETNVNGIAVAGAWVPMNERTDAWQDFSVTLGVEYMTTSAAIVQTTKYGGGCGATYCRDWPRQDTTVHSRSLNVIGYGAGIVWNALPSILGRAESERRATAYLGAGLGGMTLTGGAVDDYSTLTARITSGSSYRLTDRVMLVADATYAIADTGSDLVVARILIGWEF
jgi:hypothetical protein